MRPGQASCISRPLRERESERGRGRGEVRREKGRKEKGGKEWDGYEGGKREHAFGRKGRLEDVRKERKEGRKGMVMKGVK